MHLSPPTLHPKYHYRDFIGGILLITRAQYEQLDGMSNLFWGWGKEDDEFAQRLREKHIHVRAPTDIPPLWINREPVADFETRQPVLLHSHNDARRARDKVRLGEQANLRKDAGRDK